jgi:hypothetical protein
MSSCQLELGAALVIAEAIKVPVHRQKSVHPGHEKSCGRLWR